jgi:DNA-binding NtrC family response regulator
MVYGFVKQSGGHVEITSQPGHGTTVQLYFPRNQEDTVAASPRAIAATAGGSETILVVEDDEGLCLTVAGTLKELGYHVLTAPNGTAAVILLESRERIDLLLADLVLPGPIDSVKLTTLAREQQPHIRILCTSGYAESRATYRERLARGISLLPKPYRKEQLAEAVRRALEIAPARSKDGASA